MQEKSVNILGIETSCDETAAAVVADGRAVKSSVVASQVKLHEKYGGVVPEIASRAHIEKIYPVIKEAMEQAIAQNAGIVHQARDRPEVFFNRGEATRDTDFRGDITGEGKTFASAGLLAAGNYLIEALRIDVEQGEFRALSCQRDRDCSAEPLRGTGNDKSIVFNFQNYIP